MKTISEITREQEAARSRAYRFEQALNNCTNLRDTIQLLDGPTKIQRKNGINFVGHGNAEGSEK